MSCAAACLPFVLLSSLAAQTDGGVTPEPELPRPGESLFDRDRVLTVRIEMNPEAWDELRHQSRRVADLLGPGCDEGAVDSPYTYFSATAIVGGELVTPVGVRAKGLVGSITPSRPSLKIKINAYDDALRLDGVRRMTLNNAREDSSVVRTCLAYDLFEKLGVVTPRCSLAHVFVNDEDLGLYVSLDAIKKPLLRHAFPSDDGNLYEGFVSDFHDAGLDSFEQKTNTNSSPERADLAAVAAALTAGDEELLDALAEVLDLEAFYRFWAAEILIAHWDGYAGARNNFYLYFEPTSGKAHFLPWGVENSFRSGATGGLFEHPTVGELRANGLLTRRLYLHEAGRARFVAALEEALTHFDEEELNATIDQMHDAIRSDPARDGDEEALTSLLSRADATREFIAGRRDEMEKLLYDPPTWPHAFDASSRCWVHGGELSIDFQGSWAIERLGDLPVLHGGGTLTGTVVGEALATTVDVQFGQREGRVPEYRFASPLPSGGFLVIEGEPSRYLLEGGAPISLSTVADTALVAAVGTDLELKWFGAFYEGSMTFDEIGFTQGAPIRGQLTGSLLAPVGAGAEDAGGGCACAGTAAEGEGASAVLLLGAVFVVRRRRRRCAAAASPKEGDLGPEATLGRALTGAHGLDSNVVPPNRFQRGARLGDVSC